MFTVRQHQQLNPFTLVTLSSALVLEQLSKESI